MRVPAAVVVLVVAAAVGCGGDGEGDDDPHHLDDISGRAAAGHDHHTGEQMKTSVTVPIGAGVLSLDAVDGRSLLVTATWPPPEAARPDLRRGDRGPWVKLVQEVLSTNDEYVAPDGVFGPRTEAAVRASQAAVGLDPTGLVDAASWGQLTASYPGSGWITQLNDPVLIEPDGSSRLLPVLASGGMTPITRRVTRPLITLWSVEPP